MPPTGRSGREVPGAEGRRIREHASRGSSIMIAGHPRLWPRPLRRRKTVKAFFAAVPVVLGSGLIADAQGSREIEIRAKQVGEVVYWAPETVEVVQGETVVFVFRNELEGSFDFHGVAIDPLEIKARLYRHKILKVEKQI